MSFPDIEEVIAAGELVPMRLRQLNTLCGNQQAALTAKDTRIAELEQQLQTAITDANRLIGEAVEAKGAAEAECVRLAALPDIRAVQLEQAEKQLATWTKRRDTLLEPAPEPPVEAPE